MQKRIVILGAGPAGLSAGWKLADKGYHVDLVELDSRVGGLCKSYYFKDYTFDLGGHRFISKDQELINDITDLMGPELYESPRKSVVRLKGKYFYYPLAGKDLIAKMNPVTSAKCFMDYVFVTTKNKVRKPNEISLEDWVVNRFGRGLYNIYFGPYSEKLWGLHPSQISKDWAAQRISLLNLWDVFLRLLGKKSNAPKTYATKFFYPIKGGIGRMCDRMAERITEKGGTIHLNSAVTNIKLNGKGIKEIVYRQNGEDKSLTGDTFISTIPLPEFVRSIEPRVNQKYIDVANSMRFRSLRFLNILIDSERISDNTWIYIPEVKFKVMRIQEPKNWSPNNAPADKTSLILELACNKGDETWNADEDTLTKKCCDELRNLGLLNGEKITHKFTTKISHAYPIYTLDYHQKVNKISELLDSMENLLPIGRQGLYRYNNMDHSIKMGFLAAKHIAEGMPRSEIFKIAREEEAFEGDDNKTAAN
ncbi:MAG: FAD-dependent oxidoreductase [Deltaproteobacteria bacterium]|nr:FAD-dependent oxidoreductase [Deltaproteobacteria bacterium]